MLGTLVGGRVSVGLAATDTIQACREACGGQGYLAESRFAALKADTDVFATFEGDNTVLLLLVAKGMLSGLRRRFGDMGIVGLTRWLGERAAQTLMKKTRSPRASRPTSTSCRASFTSPPSAGARSTCSPPWRGASRVVSIGAWNRRTPCSNARTTC